MNIFSNIWKIANFLEFERCKGIRNTYKKNFFRLFLRGRTRAWPRPATWGRRRARSAAGAPPFAASSGTGAASPPPLSPCSTSRLRNANRQMEEALNSNYIATIVWKYYNPTVTIHTTLPNYISPYSVDFKWPTLSWWVIVLWFITSELPLSISEIAFSAFLI